MDWLKTIVEVFKVTLYDVMGRFVPGAILLETAARVWKVEVGTPYAYALLAFVLGYSLQGLASLWITVWRKLFQPEAAKTWRVDDVCAVDFRLAMYRKEAAPEPATQLAKTDTKDLTDLLVPFALSRAKEIQPVYDLFLALADMARGLALATIVAAGMVIASPTKQPCWVYVALALACVGFIERYWKLSPLPNRLAMVSAATRPRESDNAEEGASGASSVALDRTTHDP